MFTNLFAISDILLHFETRAAQNVSKTETEFRIFVSLKIKGGRGEMSEWKSVVRPVADSAFYIWSAAAKRPLTAEVW